MLMNCPLAARPTMTSLVPNWNMRPATRETSSRTAMPIGVDAAHRHVGRRVGRGLLRHVENHVELGRRQRPRAAAADARRLLDDVDVRALEPARHLGIGAASHHERARRASRIPAWPPQTPRRSRARTRTPRRRRQCRRWPRRRSSVARESCGGSAR